MRALLSQAAVLQVCTFDHCKASSRVEKHNFSQDNQTIADIWAITKYYSFAYLNVDGTLPELL